MTETLTGMMSPLTVEELREHPLLGEAAVAGTVDRADIDESGEPAEPSEQELAMARDLVRSARA